MSDLLAARLRAASTPLPSGRREPLHLSDPETVWWVESGAVDIFVVHAAGGAVEGSREHLYRIRAGQPILGLDVASIPEDWTLIGVNTPGTQLLAIPWATLVTLAADPDLVDDHATLAAGWVLAVTGGARKRAQPRQFMPLAVGAEQSIPAGETFFPIEPLAYVRIEQGEASFLSSEEVRIDPRSSLVPLRNDAWLNATQDCVVRTFDPATALRQPDFWAALRAYHSMIVRVSLAELRGLPAAESARMQIKAAHAEQQIEAGLTAFTNTLNLVRPTAFGEISDDPLLAACQLVGRRIGVEFVRPIHSGVQGLDRIEEIADAAHVRFRQVALRGSWWTRDSGHLLGRIQETKQPVALIRTRDGYEIHDPVSRTVTPVDEAAAASLVPFAQSFFRSLPDRPLRLLDLAGFAFRDARSDLSALLTVGFLIGLMGLLPPIVTGYVFDALIPASDRSQVMLVAGALIAAALSTLMFSLARAMAWLRIETKIDLGLQAALWDRALNLPIAFFKRYSSGDLADRLNAITTIRTTLSGTTFTTLLTSFFALVNVALLFYYSVRLAALALVLAAGAAVLTMTLGAFKLRYDRRLSDASGRLGGLVLEYLRGITKLRITGAESRAFANWAREFGRMRTLTFRSANIQNVNDVFFSFYQVALDVAIFAAAAWLLKEGVAEAAGALATKAGDTAGAATLTTGQFIAFYAAFGQLIAAVTALGATVLTVINLVPVYERVTPLLQAATETATLKTHPGELRGQVDMVNVTFRYDEDGPAILDNVSLSMPPGAFVAIVGPSGSGKSTLMRCLLGFEVPTAGGVFYDNQNLAGLDARAVRSQIGVVLQHSQLMPGNVFTNIIGTTRLTIDDAWEAARMCGLEADIKAMPMAMHTVISEGGSTLSGGQRQRILIARAIVQQPRIVLFDEATSSLDNRTQEIVTKSLERLRATRIVIAHRLTTVMNADRILLLDQGRIVQTGTYAELIAQEGAFRDLAARQLL